MPATLPVSWLSAAPPSGCGGPNVGVPVMRAAALACSAASRPFAASPTSPEASAAGTFGSPRMQYQTARKDLPCPDIRADAAAFDDAVQVSLSALSNILAGATEPLRTKPRH